MKNKKKEYRAISLINIDSPSEDRTIRGFIPYDSQSEYMGFYEKLAKGCFTKTLKESKDIRCLYSHDDSRLLARTKNSSLRFEDTETGLKFEFEAPETTEGDDILTMVRTGLIDNCSFGFYCVKDKVEYEDGKELRTILEARLYEVSLVGQPAYPETTVRSLSEAMKDKALEESDYQVIKDEIDALQSLVKQSEPAEQTEPETQPEPTEVIKQPETTEPSNTDEQQLNDLYKRLENVQEKLRNLSNGY